MDIPIGHCGRRLSTRSASARIPQRSSRNAYGALVLNTSGVLFADVDGPRRAGGAGLIKGLHCSQSYAVCELIDAIGNDRVHREAAAIVRLHDEMTCSEGLPLA
jgi:hypothetical protein